MLAVWMTALGAVAADTVRGRQFPARAVVPFGFHVVAANWTSLTAEEEWPGRGHSCIITREGKVLAMSDAVVGNNIVLADLEIRKRGAKTAESCACPNGFAPTGCEDINNH